MIIKNCKHCGSENIELRDWNGQPALVCKDCGRWVKWPSKEERSFYNCRKETNPKGDNCAELIVKKVLDSMPHKPRLEYDPVTKNFVLYDSLCDIWNASQDAKKLISDLKNLTIYAEKDNGKKKDNSRP